eukprot:3240613-Heterocapsa_arctica.AAC.1
MGVDERPAHARILDAVPDHAVCVMPQRVLVGQVPPVLRLLVEARCFRLFLVVPSVQLDEPMR